MKRTSGLALTQDRANLILSRLQPVAELHGFADVSHLVGDLQIWQSAACPRGDRSDDHPGYVVFP